MKLTASGLFAAAAAFSSVHAEAILTPVDQSTPPPVVDVASSPQSGELAAPDPDEMADYLNSHQQIKQSVTLTRTINGKVVETDQRTVTYSRKDPVYETEAGESAIDRLQAAFDREVLTRTAAFEEAKLDFVIADMNRDGQMTADEFAHLASTWRGEDARNSDTDAESAGAQSMDEETARQRQYQAFVDELDPQSAEAETRATALKKFAFMAGARSSLSKTDYIREYLLDFDSMDKDENSLLKGEELLRFRAINRGEAVATPQTPAAAKR